MRFKDKLIYTLPSIIISLGVYIQNIWGNKRLSIDDFLYWSLTDIKTLNEYIVGMKEHRVIDIQPIRDLSYFFDISLSNMLEFNTIYITNLVIWIFCLFLIGNLIESYFYVKNKVKLGFSLAVFASHPIFVKIVCVIGYRKHLLAFFFILLFFKVYKKSKNTINSQLKLGALFLASLLSQPVNIFVSAWVFLKNYLFKKSEFISSIKKSYYLLACSLIIGIANLWWYYVIDQERLGIVKTSTSNLVADIILAIGRYTSFIFIPINHAGFYGKQSLLTIIGIPIFVTLSVYLYKKMGLEKFIIFFSLFIFSLVPVLIQMFATFVSETYFMLGGTLLLIYYLYLIDLIKFKKIKLALVSLLIVFQGFQTYNYVYAISNSGKPFEYSYHNDKNCINLVYYVQELFRRDNISEAKVYGKKMLDQRCVWINDELKVSYLSLYAKVLIFSDLDKSIVIKELDKLARIKYILNLYRAYYDVLNKDFRLLEESIKYGIDNNADFPKDDLIVQKTIKFCEDKKEFNCPLLKEYLSSNEKE